MTSPSDPPLPVYDETGHLSLVIDRSPDRVSSAAAAFEAHFTRLGTAMALCGADGIVAANDAFRTLLGETGFDPVRESDETVLPSGARARLVTTPWDDGTGLWLTEVLPISARMLADDAGRIDPVTSLIRRPAFALEVERALSGALRDGSRLTLLHLEFPDFTRIARGPDRDTRLAFLNRAAEALLAHCGESGLATRLEGARYAVLMPHQRHADAAVIEAERLREALSIIATLDDGETCAVLPRIGYAVAPDDTDGAHASTGGAQEETDSDPAAMTETLATCATLALERAGSDPIVRFRTPFLIEHRRREALARDVCRAISTGQVHVAFQPIMDLTRMKLVGFEALMRWRHPEFGPVPPPEAVAIAEGQGLLDRLTRHVMLQAARACRTWPDHVRFAVNVTPRQVRDDLVTLVEDVLDETGVGAERLEIEVTEDALIGDVEVSAQVFERLRALGVTVAMDDFGAGYTSLRNLKRLSFDKIKVDKSICDGLGEDPRSRAIVGSLVMLAERLGIEVTVEGIETEAQLECLSGLDCLVQGYVFSPPVAPERMEAFRPYLVGGTDLERAAEEMARTERAEAARKAEKAQPRERPARASAAS